MDDNLIRQIENHLAGVPRVSEEFGADAQYENDRKRREGQHIDIEGYEAFKDSQYLEELTTANRQRELLFRLKKQEVATQMDLKKEETLLNRALGVGGQGESETALSDREQVLKDL